MKQVLILISFYLFFLSCQDSGNKKSDGKEEVVSKDCSGDVLNIQKGEWTMNLLHEQLKIPFQFILSDKDSLTILNGDEKIVAKKVTCRGDSLFISLPFFYSRFHLKVKSPSLMEGKWLKGEHYTMPAIALHSENSKSSGNDHESKENYPYVEGKWEVTFSKGSQDEYKAIGIFEQDADSVSGTYITETGDYRYLNGFIVNDSMYLSTFDGSHAFLFRASIGKKGLEGTFNSGKHWQEPWIAHRNEDFELRNPDSLTFLKEGYNKMSFTFPNLDSQMVSLSDEKYRNKVKLVTIMGSWCPNCMDEARFLSHLHKKYQVKGLEIISLSFEKQSSFSEAVKKVKKFKSDIGAQYDFLIAGEAGKKETSKKLPMLNHIMSYPTTVIIDRKGQIRKIHTGFYGPGTGKYYNEFVENTELLIRKLLNEKTGS